jgi:fused signal recognition particle receptor
VVEKLRKKMVKEKISGQENVKEALRELLAEALTMEHQELNLSTRPSVVLVIGVNGVGKTTTIGKIATQLTKQGKKVLLVAADTFRAAAADQLEIWAGRSGADIVRQHEGADPASVVYDGIQAARSRSVDVILIDTAGRLHNKQNLMNELNKISRIVERELPGAAREVLLVLDGTTGQNGLMQAKTFKEIAGVTSIALTKLDGTAKGGIVIAVADALQIPVKFIGVGEKADDLMPFEARGFVDALL